MTTETERITIEEMTELFGVSRRTIYSKYKPFLTPIPTTDNKVYFNKDSAITLHKKILEEIEIKKKSGRKGNFGKYKQLEP